ncbi:MULTISPECIES: hypothetical protein [Shewanella]|uniref:DUF5681 domain-containing protein n=1 Tax=Shewanella marisflavi TaxID=260364 RepID=A0ABX5WMY9_9GAMM|nr:MULTISPECIES: hypothetical protein [Shewanella]QDF75932.1 hypothetical protein FGA12_12690 [Shewanella marisflavi]
MAEFQEGNQKGRRGRPKGALNKRSLLPKALSKEAIKQLKSRVLEGDMVAIKFVLDRVYPALKPITPDDSIDHKLIEARIKETAEFEERLRALEDAKK